MPGPGLEYVTVPIKTDPGELEDVAFNRLKELIPGWEPADGDLLTIAIKTVCYVMAEARDLASVVPLAIFRYFGQTIAKVPPLEATPATALTTWNFADTEGHEIPAFTSLIMTNAAGEKVPFQTLNAFLVEKGKNEVKNVPVSAVVPGKYGNGISGTIETAQFLPYVSSVVLSSAETSGGVDEESDISYVNRLSAYLTTIAPRAITARDFSILSTNIEGIFRALAISGYNFETAKAGEEKTVGVVPLTSTGKAPSAEVRERLKTYLQELREIGTVVTIGTPTITKVDVSITVHGREGANKVLLEQTVREAIENFLQPSAWGNLPGGGIPTWHNEEYVRQGSIATIANQNPGVAYALLPEIGEHGVSKAAADFKLPGVAPLPEPGTITVTVLIP